MQHVRSLCRRLAKQRERSDEIGRDIIERPSEMRRDGERKTEGGETTGSDVLRCS